MMRTIELELTGRTGDVKGLEVPLGEYGVYYREGDLTAAGGGYDNKWRLVYTFEQGITSRAVEAVYNYWQEHRKNGLKVKMRADGRTVEFSPAISLEELKQDFIPRTPVSA